jgi:hypothetical protein
MHERSGRTNSNNYAGSFYKISGNMKLRDDVRGSVHHSKIHIEKSNKMQQYFKIYYSIFI